MRRLRQLILVAMALALAGTALAADRALLVGVAQYANPGADLPWIDYVSEMMRKVARLAGFENDNIRTLQDRSATLAGIERAIEDWLINGVSGTDRVMIYFSGHGSQVPDRDDDETDGADEVLVPHDVKPSGGSLANVLVDDRFGEIIGRIPAGEIIVFVDSCHSGTATKTGDFDGDLVPKLYVYPGMPRTLKGNFTVERDEAVDKYAAVTACRDDQTALASHTGSLFTRGIYDAVKRAAEDGSDPTLADIRDQAAAYIHREVSDPEKRHDPQIGGDPDLARAVRLIRRTTMWEKLEYLVARANDRIDIRTNKDRYGLKDRMEITCNVDRGGYINILEVAPEDEEVTVLFPNKYHPDNHLPEGGRVRIPDSGDRFKLTATSRGKSLVVVFHTDEPINAYEEGKGAQNALFRNLSQLSRSHWEAQAADGSYFGAGKVITVVE